MRDAVRAVRAEVALGAVRAGVAILAVPVADELGASVPEGVVAGVRAEHRRRRGRWGLVARPG